MNGYTAFIKNVGNTRITSNILYASPYIPTSAVGRVRVIITLSARKYTRLNSKVIPNGRDGVISFVISRMDVCHEDTGCNRMAKYKETTAVIPAPTPNERSAGMWLINNPTVLIDPKKIDHVAKSYRRLF